MKHNRKGFTIVELVIVIAVIAILAAVLIPTFSSLIQKANLSADKQAVREMNMALVADQTLHGKPNDIETIMQVLANAGYNSDNWVCLTQGYEVYWCKEKNELVLYNSATASVEYPDTFDAKDLLNPDYNFFKYNQNNLKALGLDFTLTSSSDKATSSSTLISSASGDTKSALTSISTAILGTVDSNGNPIAATNLALKNALIGNSSSMYVGATREVGSSDKASMVVMSVSDTETIQLKSNGEIKENLFYISTTYSESDSAEVKSAAQKQAASFVYSIFAQVNAGTIDNDIAIVLPAGTVINASANEWQAIKYFTGYFGTDNASNPIIIDGARLTAATGYSQTVRMNGSSSKYFMTGFFGTVYGDATIENITFRNISLTEPASDYVLTETDKTTGLVNNRNTVGIIGGITNKGEDDITANVVLRNIIVEDSCAITSQGCAGGLIGYIGAMYTVGKLSGTVLIDNCTVNATVASTDNKSSAGYGPAGGLIGFTCRAENVTITINNCNVAGKVNGYRMIGSMIGNLQNGKFILTGNNKFSSVLNANNTAQYVGSICGTKNADGASTGLTCTDDPTINTELPTFFVGANSYSYNTTTKTFDKN